MGISGAGVDRRDEAPTEDPVMLRRLKEKIDKSIHLPALIPFLGVEAV